MTRSFDHLLITGGAGFIGSNFVRFMRNTHPKTRITVLDALTYAGNKANLADLQVEFVHGAIISRELVQRLASDVDAIVNFAALTHVDRSLIDPLDFVRTNVEGTSSSGHAARTRQARLGPR